MGDGSDRRYADTTIKEDDKLTKSKLALDDADTAAFWKRVGAVADKALQSASPERL